MHYGAMSVTRLGPGADLGMEGGVYFLQTQSTRQEIEARVYQAVPDQKLDYTEAVFVAQANPSAEAQCPK